jgi:hypothetical protein
LLQLRLTCRDSESITGCTAFCQSNDCRSNDFEEKRKRKKKERGKKGGKDAPSSSPLST